MFNNCQAAVVLRNSNSFGPVSLVQTRRNQNTVYKFLVELLNKLHNKWVIAYSKRLNSVADFVFKKIIRETIFQNYRNAKPLQNCQPFR